MSAKICLKKQTIHFLTPTYLHYLIDNADKAQDWHKNCEMI